MRKAILLAVLVLALGVLTVGIASANAGPHGDYTLTTGKCAVCHRAHTAVGTDLLIAGSPDDLCFMCHSGVLNTANTDVKDGQYIATGNRLNGGGFEAVAPGPLTTVPYTVAQVYSSTIGGLVAVPQNVQTTGGPTTSRHMVEVVGGTANAIAFGSKTDGLDLTGGVQAQLECVSCHNPHGSTNYRILRDTQNGYPYTDYASHKWIPSDPNILYWGTNITMTLQGLTNTLGGGTSFAMDALVPAVKDAGYAQQDDTVLHATGNIRDFCATCHRSYMTLTGSATVTSTNSTATVGYGPDAGLPIYAYPGTQYSPEDGTNIARYRHAMKPGHGFAPYSPSGGSLAQPLRLAYSATTSASPSEFQCLTCHFAHGSASSPTGDYKLYYSGTYWLQNNNQWGNPQGYGAALDSALLFYDGRGVCRTCHQKGK